MNAAQIAQYLAWFKKNESALLAFAKGEEVQVKYASGSIRRSDHIREWNDTDSVYFHTEREYRVKPQPRTAYIVERRLLGGNGKWERHKTTFDKCEADNCLRAASGAYRISSYEWRVSEFVEVTRDEKA